MWLRKNVGLFGKLERQIECKIHFYFTPANGPWIRYRDISNDMSPLCANCVIDDIWYHMAQRNPSVYIAWVRSGFLNISGNEGKKGLWM